MAHYGLEDIHLHKRAPIVFGMGESVVMVLLGLEMTLFPDGMMGKDLRGRKSYRRALLNWNWAESRRENARRIGMETIIQANKEEAMDGVSQLKACLVA